jgi:dephospho-CoA kinase
VILVGLTGGIGAGKSTVSAELAARGAVIVDADAITREVQKPGLPVLQAIATRFGPAVIQADGALDRGGLAAIVFTDPDALKDLNRIVHPAVRDEIERRLDAERDSDHIVILDVPLLVESGRDDLAAIIVVDTPEEVAVRRLVEHRGFNEADAWARIGNQASRADRLAKADRVVDNSGDVQSLVPQIDALWEWIMDLPAASA